MYCSVRLYYNTKYNTEDIPDSPARLNSATYQDFEGNYELQNSSITSTIIEATEADVNNADYLKLGDRYFFILSYDMLNENACLLHIEEDALTSLGGAINQTYEGGILTRAHVASANDTLFGNVTSESIGPLKPLRIIQSQVWDTDGDGSTIKVAAATLTLDTGATVDSTTGQIIPPTGANAPHAITYKDGTALNPDDLTITIPQCLPLAQESIISIKEGANGSSIQTTTAGYGLYAYDNCTVDIQYLRSLNLDSAILYCYQVPLNLVETNTSAKHIGLRGKGFTFNTGIPYERSDYTARNKKVYALYSEYMLGADMSGEEQYLLPQDLYASGDTAPSFIGGADPQPNGKSWIRPAKYQGLTSTNFNFKAVHSLPWRNTPIAFNSPAGSLFIENDYRKNQHQIQAKYWQEYGSQGGVKNMLQGGAMGGTSGGGLVGMVGGAFIGGFGHLGNMIEQGINRGADLNNLLADNQKEYYEKQIVVPDLTSSPALGLQTYQSEKYRVVYIGPQVSDLQRFDEYFDYYGYAMDGTPFDISYLTNRSQCNYIQAQGIHIITNSNNCGLATKIRAEQQLNRGVRIWHTTPHKLNGNA